MRANVGASLARDTNNFASKARSYKKPGRPHGGLLRMHFL